MGLEAGYSGLREYQDQGQESGKHKVKLREGKDSRMLWKEFWEVGRQSLETLGYLRYLPWNFLFGILALWPQA